MVKDNEFRLYVNNMFHAAMKERKNYNQETCTIQEYFDLNKFWLKSMYKKHGNLLDIQD
jgi:hypothetical protein